MAISKSRYFYLTLFLTSGLLINGCKKSDSTNTNENIGQLKVFYDTLANADNYAVSMDAGYGRIFMAYGTSPIGVSNSYGYVYLEKKSALIATDNNGNLIWKAKIPHAMDLNTVVALDDGGCMLITPNVDGKNPAYSNKNLYFFRYDANGTIIKADSVPFVPAITSTLSMWMLNSFKKSNGNIVVYGDVFFPQSFDNYNKGWALEYSPASGLLWIKSYLFLDPGYKSSLCMFSGGVETPDNGLLFFGFYNKYDSSYKDYQHPYLVKTNATGDTLWTKILTKVNGSIWTGNIVATPNGNYRVCYSESTYDLTKPTSVYIKEVNQQGDSVKAIRFGSLEDNYVSKIITTRDGGCLALINNAIANSIGYHRRQYFSKTKTRFNFFDPGLNFRRESPMQNLSTDFLTQACYTSDGRIACFGLLQPPGRTYYLPHLYILN